MDGGAPQWRLWQIPVGIVAVWGASLALRAIPGPDLGTRQVVFDTYQIAVVLVLAATIGQRSPRFLGFRRMTITPGRAGLWIFLGALLANVAGILYVIAFDVDGRTRLDSVRLHGTQAALMGLCAVTLVPVAEELFFRGLVHRALRTRLAVAPAVAISSTLFGVAHWVGGDDLSTVPPRIFYGVMLALMLERTGSLYPGMVAHAYVNLPLLAVFSTSLAAIGFLLLVIALIVAVAISINDDRRKKSGRPGPLSRAQAGARERGLLGHVQASGRLGGL